MLESPDMAKEKTLWEKMPWLCSSYWWLTNYSDGGGVVMSSSSDIAASITSWLRDNPVQNPSLGVGGSGRSASSLKYGIGTVGRLNKCLWLPWELRKADTFCQNMQVLARGRRSCKMGGRRRERLSSRHSWARSSSGNLRWCGPRSGTRTSKIECRWGVTPMIYCIMPVP